MIFLGSKGIRKRESNIAKIGIKYNTLKVSALNIHQNPNAKMVLTLNIKSTTVPTKNSRDIERMASAALTPCFCIRNARRALFDRSADGIR